MILIGLLVIASAAPAVPDCGGKTPLPELSWCAPTFP